MDLIQLLLNCDLTGICFDIFSHLDSKSFANCRLVNQAWKEILDNPTFWLNKLNANGQPKSVSEAWLSMIEIAKDWGFPKATVSYMLMVKFVKSGVTGAKKRKFKTENEFFAKRSNSNK